MQAIKLLALTLVVMVASSCSIFRPVTYKRENVYLRIKCPNPPSVRVISTAPVHPQAIEDIAGVYWVGFTPKDYENLSLNIQEGIRFIKGQKGQIEYYKSCVIDYNKSITPISP